MWGVLDPAPAEGAELAAAAARALARSRMARWAAGGRRFNIVTYGALRTADVPGLRAEGVLTDRTPMHRTAELAELADAIDFLCLIRRLVRDRERAPGRRGMVGVLLVSPRPRPLTV